MLHAPKVPGSRNAPAGQCDAFDKCDGFTIKK